MEAQARRWRSLDPENAADGARAKLARVRVRMCCSSARAKKKFNSALRHQLQPPPPADTQLNSRLNPVCFLLLLYSLAWNKERPTWPAPPIKRAFTSSSPFPSCESLSGRSCFPG